VKNELDGSRLTAEVQPLNNTLQKTGTSRVDGKSIIRRPTCRQMTPFRFGTAVIIPGSSGLRGGGKKEKDGLGPPELHSPHPSEAESKRS